MKNGLMYDTSDNQMIIANLKVPSLADPLKGTLSGIKTNGSVGLKGALIGILKEEKRMCLYFIGQINDIILR